jgi:diguanylate cyclase (GGDEF)-like protein
MGGEEFLILSPETNLSAARTLAERIRQAISQIILATKDDDLCFTTSVGISEFLPDDSDVSAALKRADNALYKAKSEGKNRVCQA